MLKLTFVTALVLILTGLGFYLGSGRESITPLIPSMAGGLLGVIGLVALVPSPKWVRPTAMHVAMLLALLLGVASLVMGVPGLVTLIGGGEHERPLAPVLQSIMGVVFLAYLALGVRSFIAARKARKAETPQTAETPGKHPNLQNPQESA